MKHLDDLPSQKPTQANNLDNLVQEMRLLKERITVLEAELHEALVSLSPQNLVVTVPVRHEQTATEIADAHDARITVQRQQGAIAIAISTPQSCPTTPRKIQQTIPKSPLTERHHPSQASHASVCSSNSEPDVTPFNISSSQQPAMFDNPALPPMPIPFALSQPISSTLSWGTMMTPREVQELLAPQPQIGEYYVVTKGRRPGVYLSWPDAHELVDGLSSPCHWKKTDKYAAQGQYTVAYNKGSCEYRFQ